ncbi:MAG: sigma factor-like helix-turn-helix DNA-binding protein [Solirubrobacteraceae bacterium]
MSDELAAALLALSPRERDALLLIAWEGLTPERGATAAGCSPATFRARLHRARRHTPRHLNADSTASLPLRRLRRHHDRRSCPRRTRSRQPRAAPTL